MLKNDLIFKTYYRRMMRESILTAAGYGLMIGAYASFAVGLGCWLLNFLKIWPSIVVGLGVWFISAVLLFALKLRPTEEKVAKRIDSMNLEERTVTMLSLEHDDSYIALKQREDTREKVGAVTKEQICSSFPWLRFKKWAAIALCLSLIMGSGMITVVGLTDSGVLPTPDILPGSDRRDSFFTVSYLTEGDGDIEGESDQTVSAGGDATTVVAVAADGWVFVKWSDGVKDPARTDCTLSEDLEVTAVFAEINEDSAGDDDDNSGNKDDSSSADKEIPDENKTDGASSEGSSDGEGGEGDGNGDPKPGSGSGNGGQQGEGNGEGRGDGAGGGWSGDNNNVLDNKTDYRDVYESYYDQAMEIIRNGEELPDYLKDFIEKYYGSI